MIKKSKIATVAEEIINDMRALDLDDDDANNLVMKMASLVLLASAFEGVAQKCAIVFREYEQSHQRKAKAFREREDWTAAELSDMKASRNKELAEMCEALLAFNADA